MLSSREAQANDQLFVSAKSATAIPARHSLLRDALIQASLDPAVRSIEFIASARVSAETAALNAIVLVRDDGRYLLDVVPARAVRDVEAEGLALIALDELGLKPLTITAEEIGREPRCANARLVWSYNGISVPIGVRMRILQVLMDDGPMQLGRLLKTVRSERDPAPALMALACADVLELDLKSIPLGPMTQVRSRA
jgi:hypothetical protein